MSITVHQLTVDILRDLMLGKTGMGTVLSRSLLSRLGDEFVSFDLMCLTLDDQRRKEYRTERESSVESAKRQSLLY